MMKLIACLVVSFSVLTLSAGVFDWQPRVTVKGRDRVEIQVPPGVVDSLCSQVCEREDDGGSCAWLGHISCVIYAPTIFYSEPGVLAHERCHVEHPNDPGGCARRFPVR